MDPVGEIRRGSVIEKIIKIFSTFFEKVLDKHATICYNMRVVTTWERSRAAKGGRL
jgi:hypothetical protein